MAPVSGRSVDRIGETAVNRGFHRGFQMSLMRAKWDLMLVGAMDWFKGNSTGNPGFYHQI